MEDHVALGLARLLANQDRVLTNMGTIVRSYSQTMALHRLTLRCQSVLDPENTNRGCQPQFHQHLSQLQLDDTMLPSQHASTIWKARKITSDQTKVTLIRPRCRVYSGVQT